MSRRPALTALLALVLVGLLAGSVAAAHLQVATPTADLEANKALARRFHDEIFEQGNLAVADEILTPDFVWHRPLNATLLTGPEAVKQEAADTRGFFPDLVLSDDQEIAEADRVVIQWTLRGTAQTGSGPVPVSFTGIDIFRIEDGKLAELWHEMGQQEQLAAPLTAATSAPATLTS
jgi:predicted SnoaL-like aldol condensation-catalyzing enzyme